jgi:hypothetical protein
MSTGTGGSDGVAYAYYLDRASLIIIVSITVVISIAQFISGRRWAARTNRNTRHMISNGGNHNNNDGNRRQPLQTQGIHATTIVAIAPATPVGGHMGVLAQSATSTPSQPLIPGGAPPSLASPVGGRRQLISHPTSSRLHNHGTQAALTTAEPSRRTAPSPHGALSSHDVMSPPQLQAPPVVIPPPQRSGNRGNASSGNSKNRWTPLKGRVHIYTVAMGLSAAIALADPQLVFGILDPAVVSFAIRNYQVITIRFTVHFIVLIIGQNSSCRPLHFLR